MTWVQTEPNKLICIETGAEIYNGPYEVVATYTDGQQESLIDGDAMLKDCYFRVLIERLKVVDNAALVTKAKELVVKNS